MKTSVLLVATILLASSSASFAGARRPNAVSCRAKTLEGDVFKFRITSLNRQRPTTSIPDTGHERLEVLGDTVSLVASNECDNYYQISFDAKSLAEVAGRRGALIEGLIRLEDGNHKDQTVPLDCKVMR